MSGRLLPSPQSRVGSMLAVALSVFVIVLAAVYCVAWYLQASHARSGVEQLIAELNRQQPLVTYQAIETGGFPLSVDVRIVQPKIAGRFDTLLKTLSSGEAGSSPLLSSDPSLKETFSRLPEWSEEIAWAGSIGLKVNLLSDRYVLSVDGPVTHIGTIAGNRMTIITQPRGSFVCTLNLARRGSLLGSLWEIRRLSRSSLQEIAADFRSLDCMTPGYTAVEEASKELYLSSGPVALRFANLPESGPGNVHTVQFVLRVADYELRPGMNDYANRYLALFSDLSHTPPAMDFAAYGKQNIDIDFTMRAPMNGRDLTDELPFTITIPRFNISTALYSSATSLQLDNSISGEARSVRFTLSSESSFTKAYDKFLMDYVRMLVSQIKESADPEMAQMQAALSGYTVDQAVALIEPVVPKLHSFGNIVLRADAGVEGDKVLSKGMLTIRQAELATTPYGLSFTGASPLPGEGSAFPQGANFTLLCRNCPMLVEDFARYAQRLQQTLVSLDPELADAPTWASAELTQGLKSLLVALGERRQDPQTGADMLTFALTTDAAGNFSLNGKSPAQVMELFATHVAPHLPAAASGQEPSAPPPAAEEAPAPESNN